MRNSNGSQGFQRVMVRLTRIGLILTAIIGVLTVILGVLAMFVTVFKPEIRAWLLEDNQEERWTRQPKIQSPVIVEPQLPPNIIAPLENELMTDKRFEMLEAHFASIPSNLSLNQLKDFIGLFQPEDYRLNVVRLLQPKVTGNYSDNELEGLKKLFNPYKQSEVTKLLPKMRE